MRRRPRLGERRTRPATRPAPGPGPGDRSNVRPAGARRTTTTGRATAQATARKRRGPSNRLTVRAAVLGLVVCALALSLAYPLKQYLAQRGEISQLQQQNADKREQVGTLQQRKDQLSDPAYIRAQARQRLQYVLPGETPFVVIHKGDPPVAHSAAGGTQIDRSGPWYGELWSSVGQADRAP